MAQRVLQLGVVLMCIFYAVIANMKTIPPNPDYPLQCFDGKRAYNVGKYFPLHRSCKQMFCREDYTLVIENCGTVEIPQGYKNVQDLTKRFPHCCVQLVKISDEQSAAAETTTATTATATTTTTTSTTSTTQSSLQN